MQPPTQAAVDQARARAGAAEQERDEANAGRDAAAEAYEQAKLDESRATSELSELKGRSDADIEAARKTGHAAGRASRDSEIAAANRRAADARTQAADTRKDLERLSEAGLHSVVSLLGDRRLRGEGLSVPGAVDLAIVDGHGFM